MRDRLVQVDMGIRKFKTLAYKQYDENNLLRIVVYENNKIVDISNYISEAYFELPSGKIYKINGNIQDNTINIMLSSQILSEYGEVNTEIRLLNLNQIVTTFTFYLKVEKSINTSGAVDPDTQHVHLNKDVLDQITQEMIDTIGISSGIVDLSKYQLKTDEELNTIDKTIIGAINELNEKVDLSDYVTKNELDERLTNIDLSTLATTEYVDNQISNHNHPVITNENIDKIINDIF